MRLLKNNIYSIWKNKLFLTILGLIPIHIINTYPVKSNSVSEQVAFCQNHASSRIPFNDPKYAISVVIEHHGSGSKVAAPIAKKSLEFILNYKNKQT